VILQKTAEAPDDFFHGDGIRVLPDPLEIFTRQRRVGFAHFSTPASQACQHVPEGDLSARRLPPVGGLSASQLFVF
jgi:hypothetical protein